MTVRKFPFFFSILSSACLFCSLLSSSYSYQFNVGGKYGWVTNPSENYNHWSGRMRFQVNDTLYSVLLVSKEDYEKCNTKKPIMKMDDGNSIFKFDRSGPFYFIGETQQNCQKGQKMIIVVLAVRNNNHSSTPPKAPSPSGQPPPVASPPKGNMPSSPSPAARSPASSPVASHPPSTTTVPPHASSPQASHPPANAPTPSFVPISPPSPYPGTNGPGTESPTPGSNTNAPGANSPTPSPGSPVPAPTSTSTAPQTSLPTSGAAAAPPKNKAVSTFNPIVIMLVTTASVLLSSVLL